MEVQKIRIPLICERTPEGFVYCRLDQDKITSMELFGSWPGEKPADEKGEFGGGKSIEKVILAPEIREVFEARFGVPPGIVEESPSHRFPACSRMPEESEEKNEDDEEEPGDID